MVSTGKVSKEKRKCYFCNAVEDEPRIIGDYIVKLAEVQFEGKEQLACQSCRRKRKDLRNHKEKRSFKHHLRFLGFRNSS